MSGRTPFQLYSVLTTRLNLDEFRTLCFGLGIDYDRLRGEGQGGKARELVLYFQRRGDLSRLSEKLQRQRPDIKKEG